MTIPTLRTDPRNWLIYEEPAVRAAVFAMNVITGTLTGKALESHPDIEMRAVGNVAGSLADSQIRFGLGLVKGHEPDEYTRTATEHAVVILAHLTGQPVEGAKRAEGELHAAVLWLDGRLKAAGIVGDGWYRKIAREGVVGHGG